MRFTPRLDAQIPLDLKFFDEEGLPIKLEKLFQQKAVILNLVYFNCPMMCTEVLNGLVAAPEENAVAAREGLQSHHAQHR